MKTLPPQITTSKAPREALEKYVTELHEHYERWYGTSKLRVGLTWQVLQVLSYLAGFAAALLSALADDSWKPLKIALPLVGSFAASLIIQFRLYELTQAREQGRIAFQTLSEQGRRRLAAAKTDDEFSVIHRELESKANEIESTQSNVFFGFFNK
jgi:hypothetical protein